MSQSPAFARIKHHVGQLVAAIPFGKVATYQAIGAHLEVPPRHVAYILATLSPEEQDALPWYRAISNSGKIAPTRQDYQGHRQIDLLRAEGVAFLPSNVIADLSSCLFELTEVSTGLAYQPRPAFTKQGSRKKG